MRRYFSRIMVVVALMIKAATVVIPDYSLQMLITALIPLVLLSIVLFVGRQKNLTVQLPWIMAISAFVFFALPQGFEVITDMDRLAVALEHMMKGVFTTGHSIIAVCALVAFCLLFRKKALFLPILIRYVLLFVVLHSVRTEVFVYADLYRDLINVIVITGLVRDLGGYSQGVYISSIVRCVLLALFLMLIGHMGAWYTVGKQIDALFLMDAENWLKTLLIVFGMGLLIMYDEWHIGESLKSLKLEIDADHYTGLLLLIWCLLALIMNVWKGFYNKDMLFVGIPVLVTMANGMMCAYGNGKKVQWGKKFTVIWTCMGIVCLMLAKSLNLGLMVFYVLVAELLFVWISWKKCIDGKFSTSTIAQIVGIGAILVLVSAGVTSVEQFEAMPQVLLGVVVACIMWCVLCRHAAKLEARSSAVHPDEFVFTGHTRTAAAGLLLVIAVIKVLFVL